MFVDVHAHLDFPDFENDLAELLSQCKKQAISTIIVNGVDPASNRKILALSNTYPLIKPAFGFYPTHIEEESDEVIDQELQWIEANKPLAIGEVGLDKKEPKNFERQVFYFKKIILLAKKMNIPLIVHSRKAERETIDLLTELHAKKVVMHCFSGKKSLYKEIIEQGWSFSIPSLVSRVEQFQQLVMATPTNQLLTETDSPFLSPTKDERNSPLTIPQAVAVIAGLKKMDTTSMEELIFQNFQRLFL
ncbi:MAG: TatD family hydrolase [Candidatus Woesearchaeota archaeon]|nr:MAG: TatD family hydrolase [Candidatus Woesearchaeota archaeon]